VRVLLQYFVHRLVMLVPRSGSLETCCGPKSQDIRGGRASFCLILSFASAPSQSRV